MKENKKGNKGLVAVVIILLLACIGMGAFIFINKDKLTAKENTTTVKNENKGVKDNTIKCPEISYDLNTNEYGLGENASGISVSIDNTRKSARITDCF